MDELVAFLRERLEEDAELARAASPGPWRADAEAQEVLAIDGIIVADVFALNNNQLRITAQHIARQDPVRALAEVKGKRMAIEGAIRYAELVEAEYGWQRQDPEYSFVNDGESLLKALALPYADHPAYRPEWAAE